MLLLNGKYGLIYWLMMGDDFDVTKGQMSNLPAPIQQLTTQQRVDLLKLADELIRALPSAITFKLNAGKRIGGYNMARLRHITNQSDSIIAEALGLASVWEDIELMYAQVVKTDFTSVE